MATADLGNLTARTMFEYDNHTNISWNFKDYDPLREYLDPAKQVLNRKYLTQKKGEKPTVKATKRGFYMDYDLKVAKSIPGANVYAIPDDWDRTKERKKSAGKKLESKAIKNTYLQQLENQQKKRKVPGVATYNLVKSEKQLKAEQAKRSTKKLETGQKRYFYEDHEAASNFVPGPGAHNPHLEIQKLHLDKTDRQFWVKKHKEEAEKVRKRGLSEPAVGGYKPLPVLYTTFSKIEVTPRDKQTMKNGFGTDEKFAYLREAKVKNKIKEVRPAPCTYNTFIEWPTKTFKPGEGTKHRKNWANRTTRGFSHSVYH